MSDWFDNAGNGSELDVGALLDSQAGELLWHIVDFGALLSLGKTSDGGALGVTVTVDGRYRREYFRAVEPLMEWLAEALPAVRAACDARAASSVPRQRQRRSRGV
jgi:hypothetical protein